MSGAFPLVVVIVSAVAYHLAQRAAGHAAASPWPMLAVAYGLAFLVAATLAILSPHSADRGARTAGLWIGLAMLGIEAGFFFVYKAGWPLATASVIGNVSVTLILATIGIVMFGDHLSAARAGGIALAVAGAVLIARG
jgi:drug/metabolite transporter (DMT)-like permease